MRKNLRKLSLSTETIRTLADHELTATGGYLYPTIPGVCNPIPTTICTQYFTCVPKTLGNCF
jgi:hypothetical protein